MSKYWSDLVARLSPYVPGEQPKIADLVKLNTNENPYPPSPHVIEAIRAAAGDALRLYPDPSSEALRQTIARHHGLHSSQVFIGNGSDEVLAHAFLALLKHEVPVLFPDVSYSFYPVYCALYDIRFEAVPLDAAFALDVAQYVRPNGGIVFPNPNAPTGRAIPRADVERLLRANPDSVVVVDEAYVDFGAESAMTLIDRHPNLLVIQTLSKSRSLAGLRVGFAAGQAPLVEALDRVKNSFNSYPIDRLASAGAIAAYEDDAHFRRTRDAVVATRERLVASLRTLGFEVLPSAANFVFARHPAHDGAALHAALRARGVLVRHFRQPRIAQYLRISVGTDEQCARLLDVLGTLVGEPQRA